MKITYINIISMFLYVSKEEKLKQQNREALEPKYRSKLVNSDLYFK